jgi:hypothetical protein
LIIRNILFKKKIDLLEVKEVKLKSTFSVDPAIILLLKNRKKIRFKLLKGGKELVEIIERVRIQKTKNHELNS